MTSTLSFITSITPALVLAVTAAGCGGAAATGEPPQAAAKEGATPPVLGLSMQSVGEAMAIGRTFNEALQKGLRSLEIGVAGLEPPHPRRISEPLKRTIER